MPTERFKNIIYPEVKIKDVLTAFWIGIKPQKWSLFVVLIFTILAGVAATIAPIFYKQFFDIISSGGDKVIIAHTLILIIVQIAIINGFIWLFYRIVAIYNNSYQTGTIARLKQRSYDYLMGHSYIFFSNNFTGSLTQRVNRFARSFEGLGDRLVDSVLPLFVKIVSVITVVFFLNKWIALVILIWIIIFLLFNIMFSRWKLKYDILIAKIDSETTGYLSDTLTNQNTIQLFNGYKLESNGYKSVTDKQAKMTKISWNLNALMAAGQSFLGFAIEFLLFYFAIKYWGQGLITIGVFVLLQVYILSLIDQLWSFTKVIRHAYQAYADAKEMVEILLLPYEIKDILGAKELVVEKGGIEFRNLSFSFNKTRQVLNNIHIIIKPGEKVALVGPSGAGKTTLVKLLLRLYLPTSGKILIDKQNITEITQESLRKNIAMVPQDPILFHRTLVENIAYGKRDSKKEEIKNAAKLANCNDFFDAYSDNYVGERGIKLSGGERQRVAIARAILKNAPILVLDEATSNLDSHSELLIRDALSNLMKGRTTIVIAHRLSTIQMMDRIIVINDGGIIEQGSHNDLLAKEDSLYKKLWTLQAGGFLRYEDKEKPTTTESFEKIEEDEEENYKNEEKDEVKLVNF
ncbi:ABC transporter ATP-binding protein/permease [Patescibacteria group bacterium]|nr:ABC transporter ATP-binding protein/permease [Patescibacteria group bacterium]MBU4367863.1 ABC transporter ATP-binding protein/permease [Patescibacteria group bacterium]MBU4461682.1 ABC transporter ATP-binding protein/permease [Patescibacteria group bacterium]MCG2700303.1 ABC transporter ATP-binding protein/permease [Candidatus Parcubacteria bacterium]